MAQLLEIGSGGGGGGGVVGPLRTIYVEPPAPTGRGNNATGVRGDAALPFETLTAAMAVMQSGDTISLASGDYAPPAGPIPAALLSGVIVAPSGPSQTTINAAGTGLSCLDFTGAARDIWNIRGIRMNNDPGALIIDADGTGQPVSTFFANGALAFHECVFLEGDILARYCGTVIFQECTDVGTGLLTINSCNFSLFVDAMIFGGRNMLIDLDNDDPLAPVSGGLQLGPVRFNGGCVYPFGTITLANQGGVYAAPGSIVPTFTATVLTVAVAGPGFLPSLELLGQVSSLDFSNNGWPSGSLIDVPGATFTGAVSMAGAPGAFGIQFNGTEASFDLTVAIGEGVRANLRDSSFTQGILTSLSCSGISGAGVIPPTFAMGPEVVASPTVFTIPFALVGADYAVAVDIDDANAGVCATTIRTPVGFQVQPQAVAGNMRAIVSYYGN